MPRPNKPRTIGAEDLMRSRVIDWLSERGTPETWLADRMAEHGVPISKTSLWKMLHASRGINVDEAVAILAVTGLSWDDITPKRTAEKQANGED